MSDKPDLQFRVRSNLPFDVRSFHVSEGISRCFRVELICVSALVDIPLDELVGDGAVFEIRRASGGGRLFAGVVADFEVLESEEAGLSTYRVVLVPQLWLLGQGRTYRIFQQLSDVDIALQILGRWGLQPELRLSASYKTRRYRTQYAESDLNFVERLLEDAGISYRFDTTIEGASRMILDDGPHRAPAECELPFIDTPTPGLTRDFVTAVSVVRNLVAGTLSLQDLDYREPPERRLEVFERAGLEPELALEEHRYQPGAMLFEAAGGDTKHADDRGAQRTDLAHGANVVQVQLAAKRGLASRIMLTTSAVEVRPGSVIAVANHPLLVLEVPGLVVTAQFSGDAAGDWVHHLELQPVSHSFAPPLRTPRPRTHGVESATVVGPAGEEIHTDEFGRVRVHFHWDREGAADETASLWIPVNQAWAGASFGALNLPRIGQEVLVDFLDGDPDRPLVMGRVYTRTNPVPYKLPGFKDLQAIRSESSPRLPAGTTRSGMLGGAAAGGGGAPGQPSPQSSPLGMGIPLSLDALTKVIQSSPYFKAASPDGQTLNWSGSELSFHDSQGDEKLYMQAQKDLHTVVKNDVVSVVGHSKADIVGTDNVERVGNKEGFKVTSDRVGMVGGNQNVVVVKDVYRESRDFQTYITPATFESASLNTLFSGDEFVVVEAKNIDVSSTDNTVFRIGASTLAISPDGIIINTPKLLIHPGRVTLASAARAKTLKALLDEQDAQAKRLAQAMDFFRAHDGYGVQPSASDAQKHIPGLTDSEARRAYDHYRSRRPGVPEIAY